MAHDRQIEFRFTAAACIFYALSLLILPLRWLLAMAVAATVHELFHCLALWLCKIPVRALTLDFGGAVIETGQMPPGQEAFCALAGPVGSFALLLFARWMPLTALFGAVQGLYNLLPLYPMDGGRVLRGILERICPTHWAKLYNWSERCVVALIVAGSGAAVLSQKAWNLLPLLLVIPVQTIIRGKIPCKDDR